MNKQKTVIVTGGASGIGKAAVERLIRDGWAVTIADVNVAEGEVLAARHSANGAKVQFIRTDVREEPAVEAMVRRTIEAFGPLDAAINCAGIAMAGKPIHLIDAADWNLCNDINLRGMFFSLKHEIAAMVPHKRGAVVAVSSPAGLKALPDSAAYCASKSGINGLVRAAALDSAQHNIRVNALLPGATLTPMAKISAEKAPQIKGSWPMGRFAQPEEIAAAAVWMISDEASFVTGACWTADGGMTAA